MTKFMQRLEAREALLDRELRSFSERPADCDLENLIHAWGRLGDPGLQRLAVRFVRMLGEGETSQ